MRIYICYLLLAFAVTLEARRVRIQQRPVEIEQEEEEPQPIQYYAAEARDGSQRGLVLVSADEYNGYYGQPSAVRAPQEQYIAQARSSSPARAPRIKETVKEPPVQTLRNYNKVNDDGSFTFGYEAADGSFKEETRGVDCVVRGKYGYVDPDGNKREFTYVSGNPCDPNMPNEDEDSDERRQEKEEEDDGPANYPKAFPVSRRPATPTRQPARQPVTVFQNVYDQGQDLSDDEEEEEPLQVLRAQPIQRPTHIIRDHPTKQRVLPVRPSITYVQQQQPQHEQRLIQQTRPTAPPASYAYTHTESPINITPRPTPKPQLQLPATTYRPHLQATVTARPSSLYTKEFQATRPAIFPSSTPSPITSHTGGFDFNSEFQRFSHENAISSSTPHSIAKTTEKARLAAAVPSSDPIYSSELVFDPSTGQYKTQLYQTLPQTAGDFSLNHQIQPYVLPQQHTRLLNLQQLQAQSPLYRTIPQPQPQHRPSQQLYQQQQAGLQFQNSAQLYAQQEKSRQAKSQQQHIPQHQQQHHIPQPQQYYYIQPSVATQSQQHQLASGQIDAFLRGHNIQF